MKKAFVGLTLIFAFGLVTAVSSTGFTPLPDLGTGYYEGEQGGLYPGGSNSIPAAYQPEVSAALSELNNDSEINFMCVGMSNLAHTCDALMQKSATTNVDPAVNIINCGRPGRAIQAYDGSSPGEVYFNCKYAPDPNPGDIDVVVFFNAWGYPSAVPFQEHVGRMAQSLREVYANLNAAYPNAQLIYMTSREFAPEWASNLSPNPYAYWEGFAFKRVISERINGGLSGTPVVWGPYQYDESWPDTYFTSDGVHLSAAGLDVAGQLWLDFFLTQPWFADGPMPTATPAPPTGTTEPATATSTAAGTATPTQTAVSSTSTPGSTPAATPTGCPPWNPLCWATNTPRPTFSGWRGD